MRISLLLGLALLASACDSSDPLDSTQDVALFVGNQGNFGDNNGSVTRYSLEDSTATQNAVSTVNGLVQNLYADGNQLYVLLNFSDSFTTGQGRIDRMDAASGQVTDQYDVRTPRSIAVRTSTSVGFSDVFVTNLYDGTVTPLNVVSGQVGDPVEVGAVPEGAVTAGAGTFVANSGFGSGTTISILNPATGAVTRTLEDVCTGPRTLLLDADGDVWVVCPGSTDFNTGELSTPGEVVVLDGTTADVEDRFTFDSVIGSDTFGSDGAVPSNTTAREVYVIGDNSILRFNADSNALEGEIAVPGAGIGAIAYDAAAQRIYLGRPNSASPFGADGVVTIHNRSGLEVGRFGAGIAPSSFAFVSLTSRVEA